jgi:NadR type nicotinamide-nucleotide adenylyltransferase
MLKIAIVGPESSGKTTLCEALATHYRVPWVPEFAREYLADRDGRYAQHDLLNIAHGQCAAEDASAVHAPKLLVCDTDMITIRIWSEEKYGACDRAIMDLAENRHYDHWLLCRPDFPWEPDPLRENPHDRDRLFVVYEKMLEGLGKPYSTIEGDRAMRMRVATALIGTLIRSGPAKERR